MSALHAALVAALDAEEQNADYLCSVAVDLVRNQARLRCVAADRRVLARHEAYEQRCSWDGEDWRQKCAWDGEEWPCPDVRDFAARYDVEVPS